MRLALLVWACCLWAGIASAQTVRLKDVVDFDGVRGNDLLGYGLVVGLNGTGDGLGNSPFTEEILQNVLERLGVNVVGEDFRPRNVAAVLVTAELPPFARIGGRVDVTVSAIGDASSLRGGTLIMTPLNAADGRVYAVAQGSVSEAGAAAEGDAARVVQGVPTVAAIPGGARVEREVDFALDDLGTIRLALRQPDFTTARRIEAAVCAILGSGAARMLDAGTVVVSIDAHGPGAVARTLAAIENVTFQAERPARVVIDQRSGTIVLGEDVRIAPVAIAQGGLTLRVEEAPAVVQPNPFSPGETVVVPRTRAALETDPGRGVVAMGGGTSLAELVDGLNALGVAPRAMIDILRTVRAAGALQGELVIR